VTSAIALTLTAAFLVVVSIVAGTLASAARADERMDRHGLTDRARRFILWVADGDASHAVEIDQYERDVEGDL
jgi:hypothetical protein